ncbi:neutral zinc metallopeptidase [Modestobacter sp. VKM Ac-2979]|uniref:neutral zinc metallopeptidase n=1 Tax=unclassified Modestobacter TaxID=2643866 RepID=UPI0022ABC425|nr:MULTISPECIES: neutral zinc metallopeptidase [unclassified Modestobacter]MCZ2812548.1 neutral zinc metallopeptidase [Modestobacter sp. VKM Ac-2979]MCZ2841438.1 neutral zinc metallopeptidase [Modestobacter sp. VKM Ac-2980]
MSSSPRRLLAGAVAGVLFGSAVLSGCAVTLIEGRASPAAGPQGDVTPAEFPIIGAADDEVDRISRNALADLNTYWTAQFTPTFGQAFTPLAGGYYSVDPGDLDPAQYPNGEIGCGEPPEAVVDNAFYCGPGTQYPNGDAIQYDRAFLGALAFGAVGSEGYGRFIPALVMAHEFGHAVQGRVGYPVERSINIETQADCFAGAWTAWVADGNARYNSIRPGELDDVLRGYLLLRDPVGTGAYEGEAHGSYFDRVSAFQQGFDDGPSACRDDFDATRLYTQSGFQSDLDFATGGDAPYEQTVEDFVPDGLGEFWQLAFDQLGEEFTPPDVEPFSGEAPDCAGEDTDVDLLYCPADATVRYDEADLTLPLYAAEEGGDYAVLTAVAIPYALAARDQLGLSVDDRAALRSAVCLSGAFTSAVLGNETTVLSISPGDADESVSFLLEHATDPAVLPDVQLTGFQLVDVFRSGVVDGLAACDIGA